MDRTEQPAPEALSPERLATLAALQARFAAGLPARWAAIQAAADARELALHLHRLAGAAGSYGLVSLTQAAREAEALASITEGGADLALSLGRLKAQMDVAVASNAII